MIKKIKEALKEHCNEWRELLDLDCELKEYLKANNLEDDYLQDLFRRKHEFINKLNTIEGEMLVDPIRDENALKLARNLASVDNLEHLSDEEFMKKCHLTKSGVIVEGDLGLIIIKI